MPGHYCKPIMTSFFRYTDPLSQRRLKITTIKKKAFKMWQKAETITALTNDCSSAWQSAGHDILCV